ncbi:MAG: hypothetical protein AAFY02_14440 [Pseudomonadota bacterium]
MRSTLSVTLILGASLLAPQWALADAQSEAIKTAIADYLTASSERVDESQITYKDLTVAPDGDGYQVVFTDVMVVADEDVSIDLGSPKFTVQQQGEDWLVSNVSLPPSVVLTDKSEGGTATWAYTLVGMTATWTPRFREFKALDARMTDSTVTLRDTGDSSEAPLVFQLGEIDLKIDTVEDSDTSWSHQSVASLGPISVVDPEGQGSLKITQVLLESGVDGLDPTAYETLLKTTAELEAAQEAKDAAKEKSLLDQLLAMAPVAVGTTQSLSLKDLTFEDTEAGWMNVVMDSGSLAFTGLAPKGSDTGSVAVTAVGKGLVLSGKDLDPDDQLTSLVAPENWDIKIALDKLPVKEANELIMQMAYSALDLTPEPEVGFPKILDAASKAGTELMIKPLTLQGKQAAITGDGHAKVDPSAALQATGGASLLLTGIDSLQQTLSAQLPQEMQQGVVGALVFLKGLGKAETVDGEVAYRYVFDLPADGNATLNGQPLGALMGN